jgi:hypothetical protein
VAVNARTLTLLRQLAGHVGATTDTTVRQLTATWLAEWSRLTPAWQTAIAAVLDQYARTGVWPAPWQIARIEAVAAAQHHTAHTLTALLTGAAATTVAAAAVVSAATATTEPGIIAAQAPPPAGITGAGVAAAVAATAIAAALTARQQRITDLHRAPLGEATDALRRVFTRPPGRLNDPDLAAQELTGRARTGFDLALTRAATVARTELIDTYRDAALAVDVANRSVVTGWCWIASLDRRCCAACWAMHGTVFDDPSIPGPWGHPGCRCRRLPVADHEGLPSAEARFRRLPRRDQIAVLGPGRHALWRSGRVTWDQLAVRKTNNRWRPSWVPRPVRDLRLIADARLPERVG